MKLLFARICYVHDQENPSIHINIILYLFSNKITLVEHSFSLSLSNSFRAQTEFMTNVKESTWGKCLIKLKNNRTAAVWELKKKKTNKRGNRKLSFSWETPSGLGGKLESQKRCVKSYKHSAPQLLSFRNHLFMYLPLLFLLSNRFYLYYYFISVSSLSFILHAVLWFLHFFCFCPWAFSNKQNPRTSKWTPLLQLLFSKTLLIRLWMGWGPWPPPSAGVYAIRYAWNIFDLTERFSHVFPTVITVCGFKHILWVCVCLCVYAVLYVCVTRRCMTGLKFYNLQWNVRAQRWRGEAETVGGRWETEIKGQREKQQQTVKSGAVVSSTCCDVGTFA